MKIVKKYGWKRTTGLILSASFLFLFYISVNLSLNPFPALAQGPVYYNGAIYPTGYPYPPTEYQFRTDGNYFSYLTQSLSVSCASSPLSARRGETVLWFSSVTGGAGNYQYFWSGSDGLTGNTSSIRRSYDTPGSKYATVTVTSGGQSVTAGCTGALNIEPALPPAQAQPAGFGASCYSVPEKITPGETVSWLAVISGNLGTTTISWSGTDNLSGNQPIIEKTYGSIGDKQAFLTISSNGKTVIAPCANRVIVAPKATATFAQAKIESSAVAPTAQIRATTQANLSQPISARQAGAAPLQGICAPSTASANIGESVLWQATTIGGSDAYAFNWDGDEELSGQNATASKAYKTAGAKRASVSISSGNKKITVTCAPDTKIAPETEQTGLLAASVFSDWTVSFFLVLTIILAGALFSSLVLRKKKETTAENEIIPPIPEMSPAPREPLQEEPPYYPIPEEEKED